MRMYHLALKFAYNGTHFFGFQRQPGIRTVEGDIRKALVDLESDVNRKEDPPVRYSYASRTDRGVSAIGNVLEYWSPIDPEKLIGFLNSRLEHIHFLGYSLLQDSSDPAEVDSDDPILTDSSDPTGVNSNDPILTDSSDPTGVGSNIPIVMDSEDLKAMSPDDPMVLGPVESIIKDPDHQKNLKSRNDGQNACGRSFNPRYARERWYRYFAPMIRAGGRKEEGVGIQMKGKPKDFDLDRARGIAEMFVGTHNLSSFARIETGKDPIRIISSIRVNVKDLVTGLPPFLVIDIRGESFLWMMVRYLVGAIIEAGTGRFTKEQIRERLDHPDVTIKGSTPVSPENLILMDVVYDEIEFTKVNDSRPDYFNQAGKALAGLEIWKGIFGESDFV